MNGPATGDDLAFLDACSAAQAIRDGSLSPVAYVDALLARIEALNPSLDAFLHVCADDARAQAARAEAARDAGEALGPLHGVPFALKDIVDAKGLPTTCHSAILRDNVASEDAFVTARLRGAGAILLGKLATHEFAIGGPAFDLPWPPARNPWNRDHFTGGSSSGSGAAVASGMAPLAIGTDTAGSVRNPATACGIVGMKPTYGRVSRRGVFPLSFTLDHAGPMTRTVAENALMLQVLAGHDPADPGSAPRAVPDFSAAIGWGIDGMRVGVLRDFHTRDLEAHPEVAGAIDAALEILASLGAEIVEVKTRPMPEYRDCNRVILLSEAYAVHEQWLRERPQDYSKMTRERLTPGAFLHAVDYVQATRIRRELTAAMDEVMASVDVVVCVSSHDPICRIDDPEEVSRTYQRQARAPFNLTGHPALSVPCGFSSNGLPIGLQIAAGAFGEPRIYRVAHAYEQAAPWKERRPEL